MRHLFITLLVLGHLYGPWALPTVHEDGNDPVIAATTIIPDSTMTTSAPTTTSTTNPQPLLNETITHKLVEGGPAGSPTVVKKTHAVKFASAGGESDESKQEFTDAKIQYRKKNVTAEESERSDRERKLFESACFTVPPEFCQMENFTAPAPLDGEDFDLPGSQMIPCNCRPHPTVRDAIYCCNVTNIDASRNCYEHNWGHRQSQLNNGALEYQQIHIRNATINSLDMSHSWWKKFNRISITDGNVIRLDRTFTMHTRLICFNVSHNGLLEMDSRTFKRVQNFTVLDISFNNLTSIPNINHLTNLTINIRGNAGMLCKSVVDAIEAGLNFAERDFSFCAANHTFHWFNSTDLMPVSQLYSTRALQKECPERCNCDVERLNYEPLDPALGSSQLVFTAKVDCSNLGLFELPERLPDNTYSLNVSNNNISSLAALNNNPTYQNLLRLYADNNKIPSLLDLEGTTFIEEFEVIFLRRNRLKQIPIYLLSNALDKNPRGKMLYFEGNKLNCDCNSAKILRLWLLGHQNHIKDFDKILCENMPQIVMDLSEKKLCQSQHDWTDYIIYLIMAEVLLLLVLVMKVSYDYYIFKTQSYLPWPANKMPKLPCDWLCES